MKKRLLRISLIALPILFVISLFEVINVESYYEESLTMHQLPIFIQLKTIFI